MSRTLIISTGLHGADGSPYNPANLRLLHALVTRLRDSITGQGATCFFDGTGAGIYDGKSEPARTLIFGDIPDTKRARATVDYAIDHHVRAVCGGHPFGQDSVAVTWGDTKLVEWD